MSKRAKPKPKTPAAVKDVLCLCLTNWPTWFEIDKGGYRRSGGLEFVKLYVMAGGTKPTESSQFLQLLTVLRAISPDRYHHNVGIYFALVGLTATLQRCFRGWLLDESLRPLTERGIAQRLFVELAVLRQAAKDLLRAGLIQRLALPEFDVRNDEEELQVRNKRSTRKDKKRNADTKNPRKTRRSRGICKRLKTFDASAERFAGNNELTTGKRKQKLLTGQLAKTETANAARKGQGQGKTPPTTPAATPPGGPGPGPVRPQKVTGQAGRHSPDSGERQPAITRPAGVSTGPRILPLHPGDAQPLGDLLPRTMDGLSPQCYAVRAPDFAKEIFSLLRPPFGADTRDGARELGNYQAAILDAIDAGLSVGELDELVAKARQDAGRIGRQRKRFYAKGGSPEQYWRFLFGKHLAARRRCPAVAQAGSAEGVA
ncbi:MAG: hypothetical protein FJ280_18005 [Planctomycetes bacterium]|nr:hypothetical protein [Planctomycetota bacterium]